MGDWTECADHMPLSGVAVLAFFRYASTGKGRVVRAKWCPKFTEESSGDQDEFAEYCDARDCYYTPEGWYENNEFDENNWLVDEAVTHWMPLPTHPRSPPTIEKGEQP